MSLICKFAIVRHAECFHLLVAETLNLHSNHAVAKMERNVLIAVDRYKQQS